MSDLLHQAAYLARGKQTLLPNKQQTSWASKPIHTLGRTENSLSLSEIKPGFTGSPARIVLTIPTVVFRLQGRGLKRKFQPHQFENKIKFLN